MPPRLNASSFLRPATMAAQRVLVRGEGHLGALADVQVGTASTGGASPSSR